MKALKGEDSRAQLDEDNAKDIYNSLKTLKGSALKVAQMLSMEKNLLPKAYVEQFSLAQFSVPPLSWPLVKKVVRKNLGANPESVFDTFAAQSENAASIGQVHQATKDGKKKTCCENSISWGSRQYQFRLEFGQTHRPKNV